MRISSILPGTLVLVLAFAACENSGFGPTDDSDPDPTEITNVDSTAAPVTSFLLTDAPFPFDNVARVDVYVVSIAVAENADTGTAQTSLITVLSPRERFELITLQGGATASLGDTVITPSVIRSLRLTIDTDSSSITMIDGTVLTGGSSPGIRWQGSGMLPLNALVHEPVEISDTGAVVVVDFDVGESFHPDGPDSLGGTTGFWFEPRIRAVNSAVSGAISGRIVSANDSLPVANVTVRAVLGNAGWPENTWSTMSNSRTDGNGEFRIAYLWPRTYIIAVDPAAGSPFDSLRIAEVTVHAGDEIQLGDLELQSH